MNKILSVRANHGHKLVVLGDVDPSASDALLLDLACEVAGERWRTPGQSLFGYKVVRYPDDATATVTLDTD